MFVSSTIGVHMSENKLRTTDVPVMDTYQKLLLEEVKKKPELMHIFKVIFDD
jgi:hypothetical protein